MEEKKQNRTTTSTFGKDSRTIDTSNDDHIMRGKNITWAQNWRNNTK